MAGFGRRRLGILDRLQKLFGLLRPLCGLSEASRQPAGLLRPLCGLSEAGLPKATLGILDPRPKASRQPAGLLPPLCGLSEACLLYGLPKATLFKSLSGSLQAFLRPLCGLSEACLLSSYGLRKATLGILARLQTLPRASPQPCPLLGSWQACLFSSYGLPKATLGILARLQTLPRASPQPCPLLGRLPKATFRHFWTAFKSFSASCGLSVACPKLLGSQQASCGLSVACPKPASSLLMGFRRQREAFWTGFKSLSAAGRPLAASLWPVRSLPPLFLWASEGNVRHFGPASKASRQPAGLLRPLCGLSCLLSSYGLPKGNVRHFGPASKASRQPAGLLRPLCGLSEACLLSSYGLPKATLGILARLQTLPRASPQPCPLLGSWQACLFSSYGLPKATLGILARLQTLPRASPQPCPLLGSWQACLFSSYGLPKATLGILGPASKASRQPAGLLRPLWPVRSLPPLFLWASEGNVRHFGPASKASRQPAGLLLFLWASEGNVRHFGSASNAPQSLTAALPSSRQLVECQHWCEAHPSLAVESQEVVKVQPPNPRDEKGSAAPGRSPYN